MNKINFLKIKKNLSRNKKNIMVAMEMSNKEILLMPINSIRKY